MKRKISTKIISLVLVLTLMFSLSATTIGAVSAKSVTTINDNDLHYVSIGDSMTNGYGFNGYDQGGQYGIEDQENFYGDGTYAEIFADYLTEKGYDVDHTKLASSALRAEDLYYLLGGLDKPTDDWFDEVEHYTGVADHEKLAAIYQKAVKDADIITLGIGNASFGAFLMSRFTGLVGVMGSAPEENIYKLDESLLNELDAEQKAIVLEVYADALEYISDYIPADVAEQYPVADAAELLAYTTANFLLGFKGSLEKIVELNNDAEIIIIGLMNTTYGLNLTIGDEKIPVGDFMDTLFATLNAYMAGVATLLQVNGAVAKNQIVNMKADLIAELGKIEDAAKAEVEVVTNAANVELAVLEAELVKATGAAKARIELAIANVKADLADALVEINNKADFDSTAVLEDLSAQIGDALASVGSLANSSLDAYIDAEIASLHAATNVATEALMSAAATGTAILGALVAKATEQAIADAAVEIAAIGADLAVVIAEINEKLAADIAAVEANINYSVENVQAYIDGLKAEAQAKIAAFEAEAAAQIAIIESALELMTEDGKVQHAIAKIALEKAIVTLKAQANKQIDTLKAQIATADLVMKAEIENAIAAEYAALAADIAAAEAAYDAKMLALYAEEQAFEAYVFAEIAKIEAELDAALVEAASELQASIDALLYLATPELEVLENGIYAEIAAAKAELAAKVAEINVAAQDKITAVKLQAEAEIDKVAAELGSKTSNNTFYYVEHTNPEFICQVFDDMCEAGWDENDETIKEIGLSVDTVRGRTAKAYNDSLRYVLSEALGMDLPKVTLLLLLYINK